jgi:hypothetical protein
LNQSKTELKGAPKNHHLYQSPFRLLHLRQRMKAPGMESNDANHSSTDDLDDKDHDEDSSAKSKDETIADEEHSVDSK